MKVVEVRMSRIRGADHNPESRITSPRIKRLMASIKKLGGLIYPIIISPDNVIIDGHRRFEACTRLGWKVIPCIVRAKKDAGVIFAEICSTSVMMNGNQILHVYEKNPEAVSEKTRNLLSRYEETFGKSLLRKIRDSGMSASLVGQAIAVSKYSDDLTKEFVIKTVYWFIKNRNSHIIRSYMAMRNDPARLHRAIVNDRVMKFKFAE